LYQPRYFKTLTKDLLRKNYHLSHPEITLSMQNYVFLINPRKIEIQQEAQMNFSVFEIKGYHTIVTIVKVDLWQSRKYDASSMQMTDNTTPTDVFSTSLELT
jgi:hypothetical protein